MDRSALNRDLLHNVLIIYFHRRTDPKGVLRRMICTKSDLILSSLQGHTILNFRSPKFGAPKCDEVKHNVTVVWDILTQDYRLIPCDSVRIIQKVHEGKFWKFFNDTLSGMSKEDKIKFMNTDWKR